MIPVFCSIIISNTVDKIKHVLDSGKPVIIPTDTVYGILGKDESQITKLKKREGTDKKTALLISDISQLGTDIPEDLRLLLDKYWPGPLTVIYKGKGYRIPNHPEILQVIKSIGPIYASSANITNQPTVKSIEEAREVFGKELVLDIGSIVPINKPSTVYNYDTGKILREGVIPEREILEFIKEKKMQKSL